MKVFKNSLNENLTFLDYIDVKISRTITNQTIHKSNYNQNQETLETISSKRNNQQNTDKLEVMSHKRKGTRTSTYTRTQKTSSVNSTLYR